NLTESFNKFKSDVLGFKGKFTPEQVDSLVNSGAFSETEVANIKALEGPAVSVPEAVEVPRETVPTEPHQELIDARGNASGNLETKIDEFTEAKTPEEIANANEGLKEAHTELSTAQESLNTAR